MPLDRGDRAPDWTLMGAHNDAVVEVSMASLLETHAGLVLHTYPLDFTGG